MQSIQMTGLAAMPDETDETNESQSDEGYGCRLGIIDKEWNVR